MREELFGPILPVLPVKDLDTAINIVHSMPTGKPLNAYYFDQSSKNHDKVMHAIQAGSMRFNGGPGRFFANHNVGVSGTGSSGFGGCSLYTANSFKTFSHLKYIMKGTTPGGVCEFGPPPPAGAPKDAKWES